MMRRALFLFLAVFGAVAIATLSCGGGGFDPVSKIKTVRVLATQSSAPYARAGDMVTLKMLAVDGRDDRSRPMRIFWFVAPCINPKSDLYYACFTSFAAGAGGDAGGGGGGGVPSSLAGVDLSLFPAVVSQGDTFQLTLPPDIVTKHPPVAGAVAPYGLAIVFNMACAGHPEIIPPGSAAFNPQNPPIGCFDENHQPLGADDYVIGFVRQYVYDELTNANPELQQVTLEGNAIDANAGISLATCGQNRRSDCPEEKLDVVVPDTGWETDPGDTDMNGNPQHEVLWVDWYTTLGDLETDARLVYDARAGRLPDSSLKLYPPKDPGDGTLYAVLHDNRGGVTWATFPLHVQ